MAIDYRKYTILLVDDQEPVTKSIERQLRNQFTFITATGGSEALEKLKSTGGVAVIVSDFRMPEMNGIQFLQRTHRLSPNSVRIILTGSTSQEVAAKSINDGHSQFFLTKPIKTDKLAEILREAIGQYNSSELERDVVQNTLSATVSVLLETLNSLDPISFGQCIRAKNFIMSFAAKLDSPHSWTCPLSAMLCRLGVMHLPKEIRQKMIDGISLTHVERKIAETHPGLGGDLIAKIPRLDGVAEIVRYHCKNFDGSGFPQGSHSGDNIPWGARLLRAVIDLVTYNSRGMSNTLALSELRRSHGYYDPEVLNLITEHLTGTDINDPKPKPSEISTEAGILNECDHPISLLEKDFIT